MGWGAGEAIVRAERQMGRILKTRILNVTFDCDFFFIKKLIYDQVSLRR